MNLPQLYYFRKLAQVLHYTKAANELHITQPSLSESIASLEKELGLPLFKKSGRKIELTEYGEEFHYYVCLSLSELEKGINAVQEKARGFISTIDIGCITTLLGDYLPTLIDNYKLITPGVRFNIYEGRTLPIIAGIKSGKYSVGICSKVENEPDLDFIPILSQEIVVVVNKSHALAEYRELYLKDLRKYELNTYRASIPIGKTMQSLLEKHKIKGLYNYDDEISIGGIVNNSDTVAIIANTALLRQFDDIVTIKLLDVPSNARLVYIAFRKNLHIPESTKSFMDYVVSHADTV